MRKLEQGGHEPRGTHLPMTADEVAALASGEGVVIGAHTVSHPSLAAQSADRQRDEIAGSRQHLEALLGRPVRAFAYPFGGPDALNDTTVRLVRVAGFDWACTTLEGQVTPKSRGLLLPRCTVRDWDAPEFVDVLERWLAG